MVKNPIWLSAQPACVAGGGADGTAKSDFPFWKGVAPVGRGLRRQADFFFVLRLPNAARHLATFCPSGQCQVLSRRVADPPLHWLAMAGHSIHVVQADI